MLKESAAEEPFIHALNADGKFPDPQQLKINTLKIPYNAVPIQLALFHYFPA